MELLFLVIGVIIGVLVTVFLKELNTVRGLIEVDHESGLCSLLLSSEKISDKRYKRAVLDINHNAIISRENQSL